MLVNGKIWPTWTVEPAVYRFRVLNGCNARILSLRFVRSNDQAVPTYIIGAEGGLLPAGSPVAANRLVMGPAERFDVICDFRRSCGPDPVHQEQQPAEAGLHPGADAGERHADHREADGVSRCAETVPAAGSLQYQPLLTAVTDLTKLGPPLLSGGTNRRTRVITLNEVGAETTELGAEPQRAPVRGPR